MTTTSAWRRAHPYRHDYNFQAPLVGDEPMDAEKIGRVENMLPMGNEKGEKMADIMDDGTGLRTYIPVDESTVDASKVALAESALKLACADAKLSVQNLGVRWFKEVANGTFTRETWAGENVAGFTGDKQRGEFGVIWLRADRSPRQIISTVAHEVTHVAQHWHFGIDADMKGQTQEMKDYFERMAWQAGARFLAKMLPTQTSELEHKAAEVARLYGGAY